MSGRGTNAGESSGCTGCCAVARKACPGSREPGAHHGTAAGYDYITDRESAMDGHVTHCKFKQMLHMVIQCRKRGIVHRGIRDGNLMFDENDRLELIDFGYSALIENGNRGWFRTFAGTPAIAPPEWLIARIRTRVIYRMAAWYLVV
jgi:serine/threonine protein kinase